VFNYEFDEIGALLRKSSVNVRQISTRARKRLEEKEPRFAPKTSEAKSLADRFFTACRSGDVSAIESMLTSEAIYTAYGGGKAHAVPRPLVGTHRIANLLSVNFRKRLQVCELTLTNVNGQPGVVFWREGKPIQISTFATDDGAVGRIYTILNPEKLRNWTNHTTSTELHDAGP